MEVLRNFFSIIREANKEAEGGWMNLLEALRRSERPHWREASTWLLYNLIFNLLPVWVGFIVFRIVSRQPSLQDFSAHGEFALYSAAMLGPTLYTVTRDLRVPGFAGRQFLTLFCVVGIVVAAVCYTPVATAFLAPDGTYNLDQNFVRQGTIGLFLYSVVIGFAITLLENGRQMFDPRKVGDEQQAKLEDQFDKLGGAQ